MVRVTLFGFHPDAVDPAILAGVGLDKEQLLTSLMAEEKALCDLGYDAKWVLIRKLPAP